MKRWFCGFSSAIDNSLATLPKPLNGEMLWQGANPFWVCGNWGKQQIITIAEGPVRLAIVGTCLAPYETLVELFQNAIRNHDYSRLMRLPGSYNLIVQEEADTYVFVDAAGLKSVFYAKYDSFIVYSSLGVALQQLTKAEVDLVYLATSLTWVPTPSLPERRSPFCNVQAIPPGHYLQISSGKPMCKQYWHEPQKYKSLSEAAEQLREQLLTAVEGRVRLYGNVTSDMSGGFDSTSLALIAAKSLEKRGQKLHTITIKPDSNTASEDVKCAQHAASLYPNIVPVMIENYELPGDYSNLESIPLIDTPTPTILSLGIISYELEIIRSKGSLLHMNGEGGDAVLSAAHTYLVDLLRNAQIGKLFQHIYGRSRLERSSPIPLIKSVIKLSLTSYRQGLLQQVKNLMAGQLPSQLLTNLPCTIESIGWDPAPDVVSWCTKNLVDLVEAELQSWVTVAAPFADSPGQHQSISVIQLNGFHNKTLQQIADINDVNIEFPYLDSLVIDACLSARVEERTTPFKFKPLLSTALQHDLPKSVFTRTTKGEYTANDFVGLRQNLATINELFQTSLLADRGLIDIREFRAAIEQFNMGIVNNGFSAFTQTMATELWLRSVMETSNSFWEYTTLANRPPDGKLQTIF
ncbi:albusnodin/ikarugamycin family macrolactam cyclase [Nostoc sp. PA-18-2419]|uniref:albusnodin/ikarugamycin family macrolactam cyclase n=1 Tax=Nostoc sp. PA-18-2419 TaxID=2575443 RepID=UPI00110911AF|nr:albusnodin/ikarugamycin family macrolactam cyclase [Nostoc sp. PA-18-2419]